jgi:hypothetical protein
MSLRRFDLAMMLDRRTAEGRLGLLRLCGNALYSKAFS